MFEIDAGLAHVSLREVGPVQRRGL
jgi:hypothetical protein